MKQFSEKNGKGFRGALMGTFSPGQDARIIFGEQYDDSFYGTACAYLLRRFGPSQWGCDPYKELVQYFLTTQIEGVVLTVRPGCSVSTSFGYLLSPELYESTINADFKERKAGKRANIKDCKIRGPVAQALCNAMKELKQPVNVRDWYFNIIGRVRDCDLKFTEDGEDIVAVDYSNLAGYGIEPKYFERFKS